MHETTPALREAATPRHDDLGALVARLHDAVGSGERFRFLSEPGRRAYLTILMTLARRREAHELEVPHDELLAEVTPLMDAALGGYDPQRFRADLVQLQAWGNVHERVEPGRIRSLADRGRSKLLLRLDPETAAVLAFLSARAEPEPLGLNDLGVNLLHDVHEDLRAALKLVAEAHRLAGNDSAVDERVRRAAHLLREIDRRTERIAEELVATGDYLVRLVTDSFRGQELLELGGWLERYVERYLEVLEGRGRGIRKALTALSAPRFDAEWERAARLERELLTGLPLAGVRVRPPRDVLQGIARFFDERAGLVALCQRVNRRTRAVIRSIQRHVEQVRLRNARTAALRARTRELARLSDDRPALRFVEELVAAPRIVTDARAGTPTEKASPPRPARRHETIRPAFRSAALEAKTSSPGASRELELRRLEVLSRFVEERVLLGRAQARVGDARLDDLLDARRLVQAVAAYALRGGRSRPFLEYVLEPPRAAEARAVLDAPGFTLDAPDLVVRRRRNR